MAEETNTVFIGFGSNLGDRQQVIEQAVEQISRLPTTRLEKLSPMYESPAMLPPRAPSDWNMPFLNAVAWFETNLAPELLLESIQRVEKRAGRQNRGYWGPRELDVDILAYEHVKLNTTKLQLPHPGVPDRDFVLFPWRDIASYWRYPDDNGKTITELCKKFGNPTAKPIRTKVA